MIGAAAEFTKDARETDKMKRFTDSWMNGYGEWIKYTFKLID
jgi:hypothetical protein